MVRALVRAGGRMDGVVCGVSVVVADGTAAIVV
jgi:hypothetical protein